jgi:hypothetical protein
LLSNTRCPEDLLLGLLPSTLFNSCTLAQSDTASGRGPRHPEERPLHRGARGRDRHRAGGGAVGVSASATAKGTLVGGCLKDCINTCGYPITFSA